VAKSLSGNADILGCTYQSALPDVRDYTDLIIVDFSFPCAVLQQWAAEGKDVLLLDHHQTAKEDLLGLNAQNLLLRFNLLECGASLSWQHFFPDRPMPEFLAYVRDRDLWQFKLPHSKAITDAMSVLRRQEGAFNLFDRLEPLTTEELIAQLLPLGTEILAKKQQEIEAIAATVSEQKWHEWVVPVVKLTANQDRLVSDLADYLYRHKFPNCPFVVIYASDGAVGLRSPWGKPHAVDVSAIAKKFGGGGHPGAAGFRPTAISTDL